MEKIQVVSSRPVESKPIVTYTPPALLTGEDDEEDVSAVSLPGSDFGVVRRAARGLKSIGARGL